MVNYKSYCGNCGVEIHYRQGETGKSVKINIDGTDHHCLNKSVPPVIKEPLPPEEKPVVGPVPATPATTDTKPKDIDIYAEQPEKVAEEIKKTLEGNSMKTKTCPIISTMVWNPNQCKAIVAEYKCNQDGCASWVSIPGYCRLIGKGD